MRLTSLRMSLAPFAIGFVVTLAALAATPAPSTTPATQPHKPTLFLIGDSTLRNGSFDNGATAGQWGWGHILHYYFDPAKLTIINDAMGGTSSHSYQSSPTLWPLVLPKIQPGDFVIMQFGTNDSRDTLKGNGEETQAARGTPAGEPEHSYGWYIRQYITLIRQKGATPIVASLIPRNRWANAEHVNRNDKDYALWAKQAAEQEQALFIPLNDLIADHYDKLGQTKVQADLFPPNEAVHPNWAGAKLNAECVIEGLKTLSDCPLKDFLLQDPHPPEKPDITAPAHGELGPAGAAAGSNARRGRSTPMIPAPSPTAPN